jgi:ribosomal protein L37AE/L43A
VVIVVPYKNPNYRRQKSRNSINALRDQRHKDGLCVQCGSPVPVNPRTNKHYWLCGRDGNNCRGANNASKAAWYQREKEKETANA